MEMKYFICEHCGNIITMVEDKGVPVFCCGQKMTPLGPGTVEAAHEKHIPVYTVENGTVQVTVGSGEHPMVDAHYITWIALQTKQGSQIKYLHPNEARKATFALVDGDEVTAVYAYCNLHGLWKA